jgi:hypothetical protein
MMKLTAAKEIQKYHPDLTDQQVIYKGRVVTV